VGDDVLDFGVPVGPPVAGAGGAGTCAASVVVVLVVVSFGAFAGLVLGVVGRCTAADEQAAIRSPPARTNELVASRPLIGGGS
jgi:hypothetical protein